jgi:hypothetical protein
MKERMNTMKKIISLLLILCCFTMLFACTEDPADNNGDNNNDNNAVTVADFNAAIANTKPTLTIITGKITSDLGVLNSKFEIAYNEDGSAVINCTYEKFNNIEDSTDVKTEYTATIVRNADGTYVGAEGVDTSAVTAGTAIDLTKIADSAVTINEKGDTLTATVVKADTEKVFGSAISADVALTVAMNDGQIDLIKLVFGAAEFTVQYQ